MSPESFGSSQVVAEQYEQWVYPLPIEDLDEYCKDGKTDGPAPHLMHRIYWPDGGYQTRYKEKLDILVAGCGANAAARYAYKHPKSNVVGVDLSTQSLANEQRLKDKHNLNNLTLHNMRLEEVASLGLEFDFIDTVGVLHHLPNPKAGLDALKSVLRPDGVIAVMLYALYGRTGLYMLQHLFSLIKLGQTPEDVAAVKQTITNLHPDHIAIGLLKNAWDLSFDAGVVDMFLHPIDHAYSVEGVLDFAAQSNMAFMGWLENFPYYPEGQLAANATIYSRLQSLPDPQLWQAMELLNGRHTQHTFYLTHPERKKHYVPIDFNGNNFLEFIPHIYVSEFNTPTPENPTRPVTIARAPYPEIPLNDRQLRLYAHMDGNNTIRDIIKKCGIKDSQEQLEISARNFFKSLWRLGYCHIQTSTKLKAT